MRLKDIKEGYDKDHKCMTPGSEYSSTISKNKVSMSVKLPFDTDLSKKETEDLEADLHYAFEKVLSKYFWTMVTVV